MITYLDTWDFPPPVLTSVTTTIALSLTLGPQMDICNLIEKVYGILINHFQVHEKQELHIQAIQLMMN